MTAAIFGLIGVVVGAIISGGAKFLLEKRKERVAARVAARLVRDDLYEATCWIEDSLAEGRWVKPLAKRISSQSWIDQRSFLAAAMPYSDYAAAGSAYRAAEDINNWLSSGDSSLDLTETDRERFSLWLEDLRNGLQALLRVAQ